MKRLFQKGGDLLYAPYAKLRKSEDFLSLIFLRRFIVTLADPSFGNQTRPASDTKRPASTQDV